MTSYRSLSCESGRVSRLKSTWSFQVGSNRYVTASPSELAGAVDFITSRLSRLESDYLTNKHAPKSLVLGTYQSHKTVKEQSYITRWRRELSSPENNGWQSPMFMDWNEAQKPNGDREYCLTEDDRLILGELQNVLQPFCRTVRTGVTWFWTASS